MIGKKGRAREMEANKAQADYWTSPAGLKWIEHEHALDTAMAGMLDMMLDAADLKANDHVIDIGCGTGASTLATAQRLSDGHCLGVDISEPLLARAQDRAKQQGIANASYLLADAQTHDFSKSPFDLLISRIGMSFFEDTILALQNLSHALKPEGRMVFVCWAAVAQNPWFAIPKQAAEEQLGPMPKGDPTAPGPTAFQDYERVADLMVKAGLSDIEARPVDITLTPPNGVVGAAKAASRVGPAARIMKAHGGTAADETAIEISVRNAFTAYGDESAINVPATVNLFTCRR
jgi:SAM-dependent methyltransferase